MKCSSFLSYVSECVCVFINNHKNEQILALIRPYSFTSISFAKILFLCQKTCSVFHNEVIGFIRVLYSKRIQVLWDFFRIIARIKRNIEMLICKYFLNISLIIEFFYNNIYLTRMISSISCIVLLYLSICSSKTFMNLKPVKSKSLVQAVIDEIVFQIKAGYLKPGDKIDSQNDLARKMNVGRSCIREALQALNLAKIVEIRQGKGVYVSNLSMESIINPAKVSFNVNKNDLFELLKVRKILEKAAVAEAVLNATDADIKELGKRVKRDG
jgi:DNA-binding transcriptional regulator YhcF (GntR family)